MRLNSKLLLAALFMGALALAGCGGGSDSTPPGTTEPEPDPAIAERAAINTAITAARTAVAGLTDDASDAAIGSAESAVMAAKSAISGAANVPAAEKAAFTTAVTTIEGQLSAKKTSIMAARDKAASDMKAANAKLGKALYAALGPPAGGENPSALTNILAPALAAAGLTIDAQAGAGAIPDGTNPDAVTLKAGASAGSLGGWAGTNYALTTGTGATKLTNEARVYSNKGMGKSVAFADGLPEGVTVQTSGESKGYITTVTPANVTGTAFTHSGTQTHTKAARQDAFYTRGNYLGAPGEYRCAGECSSTNDGSGSPSALGGTWWFKPDAGAMITQSDANYLYYGWWVSKDKDGGPTAASAFAGLVGDVDGTADPDTKSGADLTGSATYSGNAAGKFAMSNPLDGTGSGGHFTADAELKAKFGSNDTVGNGMTGTIDNFRLNDGSEDPGWSVSLVRGTWGDGGAITAPAGDNANKGTVWSINGNKAAASGTWSGTMYDETPGNPPAGDGSDLPTTVTGTFYSEFSTIGRMVGGFGANKQ